ncbi:MAG: hypothetical protein KF774_00400 [Planctomyces sp.]|nr:hypothetical protein [Planctomyces sp.]
MTDAPQRPRLPSRARTSADNGSATWLAVIVAIMVVTGLISLMAMVLPEIRVAILLLGGFVVVFGGHYIVWGHWLERSLSNGGRRQQVDFWKHAAPPQELPRDDES